MRASFPTRKPTALVVYEYLCCQMMSHLNILWPSLRVLLLQAESDVQPHVLGVGIKGSLQLFAIQDAAESTQQQAHCSISGQHDLLLKATNRS